MATGPAWSEDEYNIVAKCRMTGRSAPDQIQAALKNAGFDRGLGACEKIRYKPDVTSKLEQMRALFEDEVPAVTPKISPELIRAHTDPATMWEQAKKTTSAQIAYQQNRHEAEIAYMTSKPVALAFISDQHISQGGVVNLERMEADAQLVLQTPGLYAVLGGDGVDNHVKHRAALVNSGSVPGKEWIMYDHYLGLFGQRIAAMVSGNHDDWTHDFVGIDMVQRIAERRRIFYAPDYVVLNVRLKADNDDEGVVYRVKIRHQFRFNSSLNQTHALKRMWEMDEHDFDVGVLCHHHEAAMEPFKKHGKWRWAFRPGSYQHTTGHSRRCGYGWSEPACPTVVLWPEERRMVGFLDVHDAADYLTFARQTSPR